MHITRSATRRTRQDRLRGRRRGSAENELAALGVANDNASFGHKLNGECGGKP